MNVFSFLPLVLPPHSLCFMYQLMLLKVVSTCDCFHIHTYVTYTCNQLIQYTYIGLLVVAKKVLMEHVLVAKWRTDGIVCFIQHGRGFKREIVRLLSESNYQLESKFPRVIYCSWHRRSVASSRSLTESRDGVYVGVRKGSEGML